ncbi:MAG: CPBP family intramembrane metalloprotease [Candidatus Wallbacteria bacterium]|nr:CPBP family intramembrane metalloprotease [Candidatus Wallbacteria bacterium]
MTADTKRLWIEIAAVLLLGAFPVFLSNGVFSRPALEEPPPLLAHVSNPLETPLKLTAYALFIVCPIAAIARSGRPPAHFGIRREPWTAVGAGLICFLLNYVTAWLVWGLYWIAGFPLGTESIRAFHVAHASSLGEAVSLLPWYAIVVIAEETFARCYLLTRLREATGSAPFAIVASSFAYAAWHPHWGLAGAGHVFAGGLLFGAFFVARGGVVAPAVAHFVFDALTLLPR